MSAESTALALSKLARPFLVDPPRGFSEYPLHKNIDCLFTASDDEAGHIQVQAAKLDNPQILDIDQMLEKVSVLRTGGEDITAGLLEAVGFRIDVGALVQGYRKQLKQNGGIIRCEAEVTALTQEKDGWKVQLANNDSVSTSGIINAAGAWGDVLAAMADVTPLGLTPLRRNIIVPCGSPT